MTEDSSLSPNNSFIDNQTEFPVKLSILLPVRNEGANLPVTIKMFNSFISCIHEIIIIFDFPEDNTVPVVIELQKQYKNIKLIHNTLGPGVVYAIQMGIKHAEGEYILMYAADEILPVFSINDMVKLLDTECDFINCTRYSYGGRRFGGNIFSGVISSIGNELFSLLANSAFSDSTTGIKMFRKSIFHLFSFEFPPVGWAFAFEMSIKSQLYELRLGEVPLISIDRLFGGKSTLNFYKWFIQYSKLFVWGVVKLRHKNGFKRLSVQVRIPQFEKN